MTLYRKYRSQTLDELVGQGQVKKILKAAASSGKLSQAYLLHGPKGTGKTSTARILAKIVNCEKAGGTDLNMEGLPCNICASCRAITDGSSLDVVEMDAASNRGIDDIRSLRENIKLAPAGSRKKVYIIDEVHMLSGDAFNALLKTLEEPPAHVLFILATTELQKVPGTILSRVQKLDFKPASMPELVELLTAVAGKEKIDVDQEAITSLAKKAGGSFRDGLKLLDQLSSLGKIGQQVVEDNLGSGTWESVTTLVEKISQNHPQEALGKLLEITAAGANIKELTSSLLELTRELLLIKSGLGEQLVKLETEEEKYQRLEKIAKGFDSGQLFRTIELLQRSAEQARFVSIPSLPLELAVVEASTKNNLRLRPDDQEVSSIQQTVTKKPQEDEPTGPETKVSDLKFEALPNQGPKIEGADSPDIKKITDRWTYILDTVKQYNYSLEALLRSSKIIQCEENIVVVEVPYSFHQRILEAPKSRDLLESILAEILGRPVKISAVLGKRPVKKDELANVEIAADDEIVKIAAEIFNSDPVEH